MTHRVLFAVAGQTLRHVAPEAITSASYSIEDLRRAQDDPQRVLDSGAATVPSFSLVLDGPAGAGLADEAVVPVASTIGPARLDTVVVTASDGSFELFEVAGIEAGVSLRSGSPLIGQYLAGDTVEAATISAPVAAALSDFEEALDDQRPLRVVWQYTTAKGEIRNQEQITLRRGNEALLPIGAALKHVRSGYPDLPTQLPRELTLEGLASWCLLEVEADLARQGVEVDLIMGGRPGTALLASRIVWAAATRGYAPGTRELSRFVDEAARRYEGQLAHLTVGTGGSQTVRTDTEDIANERPDTIYRAPVFAQ